MKKCCAGLAVVLVSFVAFGVGNAQETDFPAVLDKMNFTVSMETVIVTVPPGVETLLTPGWGSVPLDTQDFPNLPRWPTEVILLGKINSLPNSTVISSPARDTWYRLNYGGMVAPQVRFFGQSGVEESRFAVEPRPCLSVSPSVVTSQMTVRVQATGNATVEVLDAVGNLVRTLNCTDGTATWSREDGLGRLVPEGVYFCRYATSGAATVRKVLVTH